MPQVRWSPAALQDLARLNDFLAAKNIDTARRAIAAIRQGIRMLTSHPEIGRPVEEMLPDYREWIIDFGQGAYVALYHFDGKQVVILAVRHSREAGY